MGVIGVFVFDVVTTGGITVFREQTTVEKYRYFDDTPLYARFRGMNDDGRIRYSGVFSGMASTYYAQEGNIVKTPFEIEKDALPASEGPRLGVNADESVVAEYAASD